MVDVILKFSLFGAALTGNAGERLDVTAPQAQSLVSSGVAFYPPAESEPESGASGAVTQTILVPWDGFLQIPLPGNSGICAFYLNPSNDFPKINTGAILWFDGGASPQISIINQGNNGDAVAGVMPTGQTGAENICTAYFPGDGNMYLENRNAEGSPEPGDTHRFVVSFMAFRV